ncbi:MAG: 4Fe-4S dicluster domain-containing protein [Candidatus Lokiarchaeota archaeon]|jgi:formate hydrogenlyase subunit 6/NADH:ubiquinone oxidoreductase subunit I|nr:4Fe-4S dicluster domain-containing protein [Candidatus Lokiarchaeota archaeon]
MKLLTDALKELFRKASTLKYPFERKEVPKDFRGRPVWDMKTCIGCGACERICPGEAIKMEGRRDEATIIYLQHRCLFCGQCADTCPVDAISMSEEYELAGYDTDSMIFYYENITEEDEEE